MSRRMNWGSQDRKILQRKQNVLKDGYVKIKFSDTISI